MNELTAKRCTPCQGGVPPMSPSQYQPLLAQLAGWQVADGHHLTKTYDFADFMSALAFVNTLGELAEDEGHHPDIHLAWGKVGVEIYTHKVNGLTESDFILAAKIDELPR